MHLYCAVSSHRGVELLVSLLNGRRKHSPSVVPISLAIKWYLHGVHSNRLWQMSHAGPGLVAFVHPAGNANEVNGLFNSS